MSPLQELALANYQASYGAGAGPVLFGQAPGRVELLGNHTDYNEGLVLATAIDRFTIAMGCRAADTIAEVDSPVVGTEGVDRFDVRRPKPGPPGHWNNYVRGVVAILAEHGYPLQHGFRLSLTGNVPIGAGLSSSASLEAAVMFFLIGAGLVPGIATNPDDPTRMRLAPMLREAENKFVGVASGLLDQFSSLLGRAGAALMLDCRTGAFERLPLDDPPPAIIVCDSRTSRRLADGMYNRRRAECESVVAYFQQRWPDRHIQALRDLTLDDLSSEWGRLDPVGRKRARHVLKENDRVRRGGEFLRRGDLASFGRLMNDSHASSRDDFENSSAALDTLIAAAENAPGFLGGKLSGAGWAGCTVNLVEAHHAAEFVETVRTAAERHLGIEPIIHICHAADGALAAGITV